MMVGLILLAGCTPKSTDTAAFSFPFSSDPCDLDTPDIEVGIEDGGWHPLEDGDALPVSPHEHGGWIYVGGVTTYNIEGDATIWQAIADSSGELVSEVAYNLALAPTERCASQVSDLMAFVDVWSLTGGEEEALEDIPLTLLVEVSTPMAPILSTSVQLQAAIAGP